MNGERNDGRNDPSSTHSTLQDAIPCQNRNWKENFRLGETKRTTRIARTRRTNPTAKQAAPVKAIVRRRYGTKIKTRTSYQVPLLAGCYCMLDDTNLGVATTTRMHHFICARQVTLISLVVLQQVQSKRERLRCSESAHVASLSIGSDPDVRTVCMSDGTNKRRTHWNQQPKRYKAIFRLAGG